MPLQVLHPTGGTGHCPINTPRPILAPLAPAISRVPQSPPITTTAILVNTSTVPKALLMHELDRLPPDY